MSLQIWHISQNVLGIYSLFFFPSCYGEWNNFFPFLDFKFLKRFCLSQSSYGSNLHKYTETQAKKKILWRMAKASPAGKGQKGEWASKGGQEKNCCLLLLLLSVDLFFSPSGAQLSLLLSVPLSHFWEARGCRTNLATVGHPYEQSNSQKNSVGWEAPLKQVSKYCNFKRICLFLPKRVRVGSYNCMGKPSLPSSR